MSDGLLLSCAKLRRFLPVALRPRDRARMVSTMVFTQEAARFLRFLSAARGKKKKIEKEIAKLEKQARAEKQPKKKFELVQQIKKLKDELR